MLRRTAITLLLAVTFAGTATAGEVRSFDATAFAAAQQSGAPIVVHVTAAWCSTCRAQKPVVQSLAADPARPDGLVVFDLDFDTQKDMLRALSVQHQSTLIAYRGATETDRTVGVTSPDAIAALFASVR